jgi:hypothetical protein
MRDDSVLTTDDLPALRRMAAHYGARAAHRGLLGRVVCHALAATCARVARTITWFRARFPILSPLISDGTLLARCWRRSEAVPPAGLEPATNRLEVCRSIQLSYEGGIER